MAKSYDDLKAVFAYYPIHPKSVKLLDTRGGRSKWLIESQEGPMILRQEYINPKRMLFIAGAHWHLQNNGLPIARLIPTAQGSLCLSGGDHVYLLYEALEGEPLLYYNKQHMIKAMKFTGAFHHASEGYLPPSGSKRRTRIGKWKKLYRWKIQELEDNKKIAQKDPEDEWSRLFIEQVDRMLKRGYEALEELDQSGFAHWTEASIRSGVFCQQDDTMARMMIKNGQAVMKDLHSITIDLPARDLRIILNKLMKKLDVWDTDTAVDLLRAYDSIHPLSKEQYRVLWTDLKFPHLFCAIAHKYYLGQKKSWGDEKFLMNFRKIVSVENSKTEFLSQLDPIYQKIKEGSADG
ncbi:CotS family spore coat protein [Sporolactobacillus sp. CPB3-1]|uniref:CotS family spore coat protein n=1 Tax=Sporolactobacillus mangiferae TaxID=2940498 RepID=A0ABT0M8W3_9BACL|nr:CotS family spore coat protein [Sporolactobacillus mangiferae]MCL1631314.1 CotS family spore coat protein [Sporolactobacillus mangiferae]